MISGSNRLQLQLTLWTCSQTSRGYTSPFHLLLTSGDKLSHMDTRGWRYSPRLLTTTTTTITYGLVVFCYKHITETWAANKWRQHCCW